MNGHQTSSSPEQVKCHPSRTPFSRPCNMQCAVEGTGWERDKLPLCPVTRGRDGNLIKAPRPRSRVQPSWPGSRCQPCASLSDGTPAPSIAAQPAGGRRQVQVSGVPSTPAWSTLALPSSHLRPGCTEGRQLPAPLQNAAHRTPPHTVPGTWAY